MEKYAVVTEITEDTKTASSHSQCSICGKEAIRHGSVLLCPDHGSQGFERKSEQEKK